jgi:acetoin:2,6-dichlorophenolindophenol oxidoreductase subunit alpha
MAPSGHARAILIFQNAGMHTDRDPSAMRAATPNRLSMLETMLMIRAYEERMALLAVPPALGPCSSIGQEAGAVGVVSALQTRDRLLTNHRSAGHLIARGADPGRLMAEVLGRSDGYCKGKGGSLHISASSLGVVLTSAVAGSELSLAPCGALAQKLGAAGTEPGGVTAVFFGDGAACEGMFHESLNLAVTWQLPLLFVCENNQWQGLVQRQQAMPIEHVRSWAAPHGLEAITVDGNDVETVLDAAQDALASIRRTGHPCFLELLTYRRRAHWEPHGASPAEPRELSAWCERDPIDLHCHRLLKQGETCEGELAALRARVHATIAAALSFAQHSPWPAASELTSDVYA